MKLYVDDRGECPSGWQQAETVTQAIRMLATGMVDEIDMPYDLKRQHPQDCIETCEPIAYYVALLKQYGATPIAVKFHAIKPEGEQILRRIISRKNSGALLRTRRVWLPLAALSDWWITLFSSYRRTKEIRD